MKRTLVVHSHFYQPPRENPWTRKVHREPSAAPFHNWNQRIAVESYRPNAFAHIVDDSNHLTAVVNNFAMMSFDTGPTLLSWLQRHAMETYERIRAADEAANGGMAQAYSHMILPLANEEDMRTQVRWALAEFRHRFNREVHGLWLPECAVSDEVLEILAQEGVGFTVLATHQATTPVDPRRPYRWKGRSGSIDIVFYDEPLSHRVAFGWSGTSSQELIDRIETASPEGGLVLIATDGETFGHHHKYGERGLAYALAIEAPRRGMEVTNLTHYLRDESPREDVEVQLSSWSCPHGVMRWAGDCGCSTGGLPGENQKWRAPLREALDLIRDFGVRVFDSVGAHHLRDPWGARNDFIRVILDESSREVFSADHIKGDVRTAFALLQAQYHAMMMYTSCGWFFHDISGIETVLVLRHASRMMELLDSVEAHPPRDRFLDILGKGRSNYPHEGNGALIWQRHVVPSRNEQLDEEPSELFDEATRILLGLVNHAIENADEESAGTVRAFLEQTKRENIPLYVAPAQEAVHFAIRDSRLERGALAEALGVGEPLELKT